ncbi:hypothetical protein HDZ31DRAFT_79487 [Schizophyllum fasciatum]
MAAAGSKFQAFMNHPAGPKTVFFWAPLMKWCLVAAGLKDLSRPADKLSVSQNVALAATGFIWVRYSLVITPVNYSLAAVRILVRSSLYNADHRIGQLLRRLVRLDAAHPRCKLPPFAAKHDEGMNSSARLVLPISYPCFVVDRPIAQCHAVRIHVMSVKCSLFRLRSLRRLLLSCRSSSVSSDPEKDPKALDASPSKPPFSCR